MGKYGIFTTRLAALLVLHAAGAGYASPTVLVTRPLTRVVEWLPTDNQTVYRLDEGETRSLELNTSTISQSTVYITVSPCTSDLNWILYRGTANPPGHLSPLRQNKGSEVTTVSLEISQYDRYILQLSTAKGGSCVVSARGEAPRQVRLRLKIRSRRKLAANWDSSPIDPQATSYCVVASHRRNYTSLCAAHHDVNPNRLVKTNRLCSGAASESDNVAGRSRSTEINNNNDVEDAFSIFDGHFRSFYRRKKFGRSTKVTSDEDPVIACVGDRTHHLIENLDPTATYYVSVFGVAKDRRSGSLLAISSIRPRTSTAKRLRENVPYRADIKGKTAFYFKASIGTAGGLWLMASTCGGSVDLEVLVKGKRLQYIRNIEPNLKFFVPAPTLTSSMQETSDEGSIQFDSSSEETRMRYVIKLIPTRKERDGAITVELTASTTRWGINTPELIGDGAIVRELRPRRSCRSVDIAFLPATHNATDVIRYCAIVRDSNEEVLECTSMRKYSTRTQCINQSQKKTANVIIQKINGLTPGKKYAIQVTAAVRGSSVPYKVLYADTNASCREK
ncbi:protein NDNF [Bombyx mori]|uniref:protein NDNF n=1 Tax=Bombyx mori TaxID=7091 RepID=UPI002ED2DCFA